MSGGAPIPSVRPKGAVFPLGPHGPGGAAAAASRSKLNEDIRLQRIQTPQTGCRGVRLANSAGMNTKLATSVQPRLISSNSPMLAVPG